MCVSKLSAQADGLVASGAADLTRARLGLWLDEEFHLPGDRKLVVTLRVELREPTKPVAEPVKSPTRRLDAPSPLLMIEGPRR